MVYPKTHCLHVATFWSRGWKEDFHSKYVAGLIKLPMTYHMCTGTLPPDTYWSPFTEKCDEDNNSLEIVTSVVYSVIFLLFGSAAVYESMKSKAQATQQIDPSCNIQVNIAIKHWKVAPVWLS